MCTRFYIDNTLQLENYAEQAKKTSLGRQMAIRLPLSLTSLSGEIRPEMAAPVIASNRSFERTVFPMLWGYHLGDKAPLLVNARTETAKVKPTFMDSWLTDARSPAPGILSGSTPSRQTKKKLQGQSTDCSRKTE